MRPCSSAAASRPQPGGDLAVFDVGSGKAQATLPDLGGSGDTVVNPKLGQYYQSASSALGGPGLRVIDIKSRTQVQRIPTSNGAHSIAISLTQDHRLSADRRQGRTMRRLHHGVCAAIELANRSADPWRRDPGCANFLAGRGWALSPSRLSSQQEHVAQLGTYQARLSGCREDSHAEWTNRNAISGLAFAVALLMTVAGARASDDSKYPDFGGQWKSPPGVSNQYDISKPRTAEEAPLTPEYQAIFEAILKDQAAGGQGTDPTYTCIPDGMRGP